MLKYLAKKCAAFAAVLVEVVVLCLCLIALFGQMFNPMR